MICKTKTIGDCTLYLGDCNEVIREIKDKSITLIHTDPPYLIHSESSGGSIMKGAFWDRISNDNLSEGFDLKIFNEFERVTKHPNFQIWGSKRQFLDYVLYATDSSRKYNWQDIMLYRNNPAPSINGKYLDKDYCVHMWSGRKITGDYNDKVTGYHWTTSPNREYDHPTIKPLLPIIHMIRTGSEENDIVLDPFMGTGTTGEACVITGRRFIGIEKNERYFNMAVKRIMNATEKGLF